MALDPSIILRGQPLDVVGAMRQGNAAAMETNALRQQNQLADVYRTQGAGIMRGDQNALAGLAAIDPGLAQGFQMNSQTMAQNTRTMEILNAEEKRAIADAAAQMDAAQKEAALAQARQEVFQIIAAPTPELFDQMVTQAGKPELVGQFENRKMLGAQYITDVADVFALVDGPKPADEYERYAQEETSAGRQPLDRIGFEQAKKGKGMSYTTTNPDGTTTTFSMGGSAKDPSNPTVGDVYNPAAATDAIGLIDNILGVGSDGQITPESRATIERITGTIEGGGGNNIDDMGSARRFWYGEKGVDKIEKLGQLQSKAWLAARDMLKGGGAITDYESRKAEAAVARLSRAKGPEEFISALTELKEAIRDGKAKLDAARAQGGQPPQATPQATGQTAPTGAPQPGVTEDGYRFRGGDPADPANWELVQ